MSTDDPSPPPAPRPRRGSTILMTGVRALIGVAVLGVAGAIAYVLVETQPEVPRNEGAEEDRRTVSYITLETVEAPRVWRAFGTARAKNSAELEAEVAGIVEERPDAIEAGARVEAGELIVRLESDEYEDIARQTRAGTAALNADLDGLTTELESLQESLALAQESVQLTERELERFRDAQRDAGIADIELDRLKRQLTEVRRQREELRRQIRLIPTRRARLEAQLAQERAALSLAELNLRRTEIRAPIGGDLQEVFVEEGERVAPGGRIARLVDRSVIEIPVRAPVSAAPDIARGDDVLLTTGGPASPEWIGAVDRIAPEADEDTRTLTVFVVFEQDPDDESSPVLLPGQYLTARLTSARAQPRVIVPRSSVEDDRVATIDDENRVRFASVGVAYHLEGSFPALHPTETQWSVIASGLEPGQRVLMERPSAFANPGLRVDPVRVGATPERPIGTASNGGAPEDLAGAGGDAS